MYEKEIANEYNRSTIYISTSKPYEIDEKMEELENLNNTKGIFGENLYKQRLEEESNIAIFKFIFYTFLILTILFCMIYMFNIISSSVIFRKKDFAILKSIGMSQRQVDKMLFLEGIFYGFSAIIFGIMFSFLILYLLSKIAIDENLYIFEFPIVHITYAIFMIYTIILFGMINARKKVKEQNIIEDIK